MNRTPSMSAALGRSSVSTLAMPCSFALAHTSASQLIALDGSDRLEHFNGRDVVHRPRPDKRRNYALRVGEREWWLKATGCDNKELAQNLRT